MKQFSLKWSSGKKIWTMRNCYFKEKSAQHQIYDDFQKMVTRSKYEYEKKKKPEKNIRLIYKEKGNNCFQ